MSDSAGKDLPIAENNACARPIRSTRSKNKASIAVSKSTSRGSGRRPTTRSCSKLQAGFIKPESHDEAIIGPTINSVAKKSRAKVAVKQPNNGRIKYFTDFPLDALATPEDTRICDTTPDSDLDRHARTKPLNTKKLSYTPSGERDHTATQLFSLSLNDKLKDLEAQIDKEHRYINTLRATRRSLWAKSNSWEKRVTQLQRDINKHTDDGKSITEKFTLCESLENGLSQIYDRLWEIGGKLDERELKVVNLLAEKMELYE
ncbi:hypothetical protein ACLX1H_007935 [Fusarium chlamydosporum]